MAPIRERASPPGDESAAAVSQSAWAARPVRSTNHALLVGAGYSVADQYRSPPPAFASEYDTRYSVDGWAHWAHVELGYEWRADIGILIRTSLGVATLLNSADLKCHAHARDCVTPDRVTLLTTGIAIGYAF